MKAKPKMIYTDDEKAIASGDFKQYLVKDLYGLLKINCPKGLRQMKTKVRKTLNG